MKLLLKLALIILSFCPAIAFYGQNSGLDSLWNVYKNAKHDTTRIKLLNEEIGYLYESINPDSAILLYKRAMELADKNLEVLKYSNTSSPLPLERERLLALKATSLRYIGIVHHSHGRFDKALENYILSLKIFEEMSINPVYNVALAGRKGMSASYNNI